MKIYQYSCLQLTQDYQKKGDNPECKDQWILLNKEQCQKHNLLECEPIIGPGKFTLQNTNKLFYTQTPSSCLLIQIVQNKLFAAFKDQLLQYDTIQDLLSINKSEQCQFKKQYTISGQIISLHSYNDLLIIQTNKSILVYKDSHQILNQVKEYQYQKIKQLNIDNNILFLCLSDKLVKINLINFVEQLKIDNLIQAGYMYDKNYYYICNNDTIIINGEQKLKINSDQLKDIQIKQIFVKKQFLCVIGYTIKYEQQDEDDEDDQTTYGCNIYWFDLKNNQPLKNVFNQELELKNDTKQDGDFGIYSISDLVMIYGSNLSHIKFWQLTDQCKVALQYEKTNEELNLINHSEIRGCLLYQLTPYIGFGINQKSFRNIERFPNIIVLNKKGELLCYEFLDFKQLIDYVQIDNQKQQSSIILSQTKQQSIIKSSNTSSNQNISIYQDVKYTMIESDQKELNKMANPPFNLYIQQKEQSSSIVFGAGSIKQNLRLHQNQIPSANLATNYKQYQIIGHEREIILLTPNQIQCILQNQIHEINTLQITNVSSEYINGVYQFQQLLLIQTNYGIYLVSENNTKWNINQMIQIQEIKRIQILKNYILIQAKASLAYLYIYQNNNFQQIWKHNCDASGLFNFNDQMQILFISEDQLFILKDLQVKQQIQIDFIIKKSQDYFITQLHKNLIYISYISYQTSQFQHYIVNYDFLRNQAKEQTYLREILNDNNINDMKTEMNQSDWNITYIITNVTKIIIIFPNFIQSGIVLQVCGDDLRIILDQNQDPVTIPCYTNIIKGMSVLWHVLPQEKMLGLKPGFCKAKKDSKEIQYQMQPSLLLFEYNEENELKIHRYLLIKLEQLQDQESLLSVFIEQPQRLQESQIIKKTDNQKISVSSISNQSNQQSLSFVKENGQLINEANQYIIQIYTFCQAAQAQLNGEIDTDQFLPSFNMFTPQQFLDDCQAKYQQIFNNRYILLKKIKNMEAIQTYYLQKKQIIIPEFKFYYDNIESEIKKLSIYKEYHLQLINFIIQTLKLNPLGYRRISFGDFNFPTINHIKKQQIKKQIGHRKIAFEDQDVNEDKKEFKHNLIQKLLASKKKSAKYFKISNVKILETNDLAIQQLAHSSTSFGVPSYKLLKQPQSDNIIESQKIIQNSQSNIQAFQPLQTVSQVFTKNEPSEVKKITKSKGQQQLFSSFDQSSEGIANPLASDIKSNSGTDQSQMSKKQTKAQYGLVQNENQKLINQGELLSIPSQLYNPLENLEKQGGTTFKLNPQQIFQSSKPQQLDDSEDDYQQNLTMQKTESQVIKEPKSQNNAILSQPPQAKPAIQEQPQQLKLPEKQGLFSFNLTSQPKPDANENTQTKPLFAGITGTTSIFGDLKIAETSVNQFLGSQNTNTQTQNNANQQNTNKQESSQVSNTNLNQQPQQSQQTQQNSIPNLSSLQTQPPPVTNTSLQPQLTQSLPIPSQQPQQTQQVQQQPSMNLSQKQPLTFEGFNQTQGSSILQQSQQSTYTGGMQTLGFGVQGQGQGLNINISSFGSGSVFDKSNQKPIQTQQTQKIQFTGLSSSQSNQQAQPATTFGSIFGTGQAPASFLATSNLNFGFDPNNEAPRK